MKNESGNLLRVQFKLSTDLILYPMKPTSCLRRDKRGGTRMTLQVSAMTIYPSFEGWHPIAGFMKLLRREGITRFARDPLWWCFKSKKSSWALPKIILFSSSVCSYQGITAIVRKQKNRQEGGVIFCFWRREGDSNPRPAFDESHAFQACQLNHSCISP